MKLRSGILFALPASLVLGACATAGAPAGPVVSPTGVEYPAGIAQPEETEFTTKAELFLAQQNYQAALEQAQLGIEADTLNPYHYFIAGRAHAGLEHIAAANEAFERAEEIYPAYELEIEPAREAAWTEFFNAGVEAYNAGDLEAATAAWARATEIYNKRPEAFLNLAVIYTQQDEYDQAIEAYQGVLEAVEQTPVSRELIPEEIAEREESAVTAREGLAQLFTVTERYAEAEALYRSILEEDPADVQAKANLATALAQQGREAEAQEIYSQLLSDPALGANDLFNVGVGLFNAKDFARAAEAFQRVTELAPYNRDAWYNLVNALYAQDLYEEVIPAAQRLVEVDPLNQNAALILARAYRETERRDEALAVLQANAAVPAYVEQLQLRNREGAAVVQGILVGNESNEGAAGTPVQLRFTFIGPEGELGAETVTVAAPAADATADFEVVLQTPTPAVGYRYELVR